MTWVLWEGLAGDASKYVIGRGVAPSARRPAVFEFQDSVPEMEVAIIVSDDDNRLARFTVPDGSAVADPNSQLIWSCPHKTRIIFSMPT